MKKHLFFLILTLGIFTQTPSVFAQFGPPGGGQRTPLYIGAPAMVDELMGLIRAK